MRLAEQAHRFYGGKMQTVPKAGVLVLTGLTSGIPRGFPGFLPPSGITMMNLLSSLTGEIW